MATYSGRLVDYLSAGLFSARPAGLNLFPKSVGIYFATDTNKLWFWEGNVGPWKTANIEPGKVNWGQIEGNIPDQADLVEALGAKADSADVSAALDDKVDKVPGKGLSTNDFTGELLMKLTEIEEMATRNSSDSYLLNRQNHAGLQAIGTVTGLQTALDAKVVKEAGKGLSTNDYTTVEKTKLEGIAAGAQVNTVNSVAGKTGVVTLAKGDVGLGNVDNTSDANKPVSAAQAAAIATKINKAGVTLTPATIAGFFQSMVDRGSGIYRGDSAAVPADVRFASGVFSLTGDTWTYIVGVYNTGKIIAYSGTTSDIATETWKRSEAADSADVVKLLGTQSIADAKTFLGRISIISGAEQPLQLFPTITSGGIPQAFAVSTTDEGSPDRISAQLIRFTYNRRGTSSVSAFDSLFVTTPQIHTDAPYQLRGFTFEGPVVAAGKMLGSYTALKIQPPSGAGAVGATTAIEVDANAGPVLISALGNGVDLFRCGGPATVGPLNLGQYSLSTLPSAAAYDRYYITVSDATGGPKLCTSDGANWLLVNTSTVVS